jgi:hypothetical protein
MCLQYNVLTLRPTRNNSRHSLCSVSFQLSLYSLRCQPCDFGVCRKWFRKSGGGVTRVLHIDRLCDVMLRSHSSVALAQKGSSNEEPSSQGKKRKKRKNLKKRQGRMEVEGKRSVCLLGCGEARPVARARTPTICNASASASMDYRLHLHHTNTLHYYCGYCATRSPAQGNVVFSRTDLPDVRYML